MQADEATVDLERQVVAFDGREVPFEINPEIRERLLKGLDDIALTLEHVGEIERFERGARRRSGRSRPPSDTDGADRCEQPPSHRQRSVRRPDRARSDRRAGSAEPCDAAPTTDVVDESDLAGGASTAPASGATSARPPASLAAILAVIALIVALRQGRRRQRQQRRPRSARSTRSRATSASLKRRRRRADSTSGHLDKVDTLANRRRASSTTGLRRTRPTTRTTSTSSSRSHGPDRPRGPGRAGAGAAAGRRPLARSGASDAQTSSRCRATGSARR